MSASKVIKQIMVERDLSVKDLAAMLDIKPQILSNKLYRDTFSYTDYINALPASRRLNNTEPFLKFIAECVIETERDYCRLLKL